MLQVEVNFPGKKVLSNFSRLTNVGDIKGALTVQTGVPAEQIRLELRPENAKKIVLGDAQILDDYHTHLEGNKLTLYAKDIGKQIGYSSLFYIEYAFPPLAVLFFYLLNIKNASSYNTLLTLCIIFHFGKRLLETHYVHIFSTPSVPFFVLMRNCIHYWLIIGILLPLEVFFLRSPDLPCCSTLWLLLFIGFELGNLYCHIQLRRLREVRNPNGTVEITMARKVPSGLFFDQVMSPNYTFEILAWLTFTILFKTFVGLIFTILSAAVMTSWAIEKKNKLINASLDTSEKDRLKKRFATIPYVV